MNNTKDNTYSNIRKLLTIIFIIIAFTLTGTYAFLNLSALENTTTAQAGCFEVNYSAQEISSDSLMSTTNYLEGAHTQVTLSKNENCEIYTEASIYIHTSSDTTTAPLNTTQALKYKVLYSGTEISTGVITIESDDTLLATVDLTEDERVYDIYIWIDSNLSAGLYNNTTYSGYIYAESIQSSTIPSQDDTTTSRANSPNLDSGNLIPVYYDETAEVWKKADSTNSNNSWYDYDNKKWANAVMVKDNTKRSTYQSADVNTTITESDISGFLVWIPRFKYRVWNITRQAGTEDTYAYPAYTNGIDIEWESGTASTGNVSCSYNVANSTPATTLSDQCTVDGTAITPESGNTNFTNAWYTHPAFKFNNSNKTGFWIGKFETTGTSTSPTVLPDLAALVNQNVSTQFTTSKVFQTYGLSNNVDAHMLTNIEWGAMAYLTHSIYGLCDGTTCRDAYINNSEDMITGRSAGVLAFDYDYSTHGDYNYKGYPIDSNTGSQTGTKDTTLVASSTGNITGVYDISGGTYEYVMGNMVDKSNVFNPGSAGDSWNGSTTPSTFYYNSYSYGKTYSDQTAFNRAYLGDATAEVTGNEGNYIDAWQPGTDIIGSDSLFVDPFNPWFFRGGGFGYSGSGSFSFSSSDGNEYYYFSFRLSLS